MVMDDFLKATLGSEVVRYYPSLAKYVGGAKTALFLSQLIYWLYNPKMQEKITDNDGWFYISTKEMEDQTGLTKNEQLSARKDLEGIVETSLKGRSPMTLHYRLNIENLNNRISQLSEKQQTSLLKTGELVCGKTANQFAEKQQTSLLKTGELVCGKTANFNTDTTDTTKDTKADTTDIDISESFKKFESLLNTFSKLTGRKIPGTGSLEWIQSWDVPLAGFLNEADGDLNIAVTAMTKAIEQQQKNNYSTSSPSSVRKLTLDYIGKMRIGLDISNKSPGQRASPNEPKGFAAIREYMAREGIDEPLNI